MFVAVTRDENGLCIKCEPGEPGEFVGKIVKGKNTNSSLKIIKYSRRVTTEFLKVETEF